MQANLSVHYITCKANQSRRYINYKTPSNIYLQLVGNAIQDDIRYVIHVKLLNFNCMSSPQKFTFQL